MTVSKVRTDGTWTPEYSTGENLMAQLVNLLLNDNRTDDVKRIAQDSAYRNQLYEEYGILKQ